ncbi:MAG: co-chaperone GroES [Pseudomonadales bacterium]|jgi:chaperonin GroES|nr:co-chaperone GroES [Pseudomonadales bacterium]
MKSKISAASIKPTPGYALIKGTEKEGKTASGIILPTDDNEKPQFGKVLAVGDSLWASGVKEIKSPVKPGDHVFYKKWGGNEIKIEDEDYQILKFEDILAVAE